ncbi:MAG: hypothetical protein R2849_10625 [Thermomicrobiales bacterium]
MNVRRRRILYASITALVLSATLLVSVAADWDLTAGDSAVAYTGGDGVILRTQPGGEIIDYLPEGYPLTIQDGYYASDGSYWYSVSVDRLGLVRGLGPCRLRCRGFRGKHIHL